MNDTSVKNWGVRQLVVLIMLIAVSLLGNVFAPRLFTGFNYLFGSVGVMLILRLFGIGPALFAALLAAAWCKQLFGHLYPLFWLGLEPVFVGIWLRRRPKGNMILADIVYWPLLGIPLLFFFFRYVMQVALVGTYAASLMYWVIGITNAMLATIIITYTPLERIVWPRRAFQPVPVNQGMFHLLMAVILLPAIFVLILNGQQQEDVYKHKMSDSLELSARRAGYEVRQQFFPHGFPRFVTQGSISAGDRQKISEVLEKVVPSSFHTLTLLDGSSRVIASSSKAIAAMETYDPLSGGVIQPTIYNEVFRRMPPNHPPIPLWQRAGRSSFVRVQMVPLSTLRIVSETVFAPYQKQILTGHAEALSILLLYVVVVLSLSMWISSRISRSLQQLSCSTTDLPSRLLQEEIDWPVSSIAEIDQLISNAQLMAHTLSGQFREIGQINADLENRVDQRTTELRESNESLRQEIDERIRAERQRDHLMDELTVQLRFLQTLMDAIPNPVYFKDLQGRFQGFNQAFGTALGVSREQVIGKTVDALYSAKDAAFYREKDEQLLRQGGVQLYETELTYADGKIHTIIVSKAGYHSLAGELSGLIGVFVDITARKQAELELDQLMRELQVKNKELESIIYVSSHDLRSPLVNIQGFSRKLAKSCTLLSTALDELELPSGKQQELLQLLTESMPRSIGFITSSVEKMDTLLSGLLRLSRLGRAAITLENLDMNLVMGKIRNSLAYQLESTGTQIIVDDLLPCLGDAVQINQVFTNLLDNAIKYRSMGRPLKIRVSSISCPDGVQYCVEDNGIGIHSDYQDQVWEIFHRINPRDIPGEGLGLTVARRILDRLNGSIWLESEEGQGSRFYVKLPVTRI